MATFDPHSFADEAQPRTKSLDLALKIDFETRVLEGHVTLRLSRKADGALDLDTRDLAIESAVDGEGKAVPFELGPADAIRGARLRLAFKSDRVTIRYRTSATATAMGWLEPAQTKGGGHPFAFTQCQAIHARSVMPCQDTPRVRVTYRARLDVPEALRAVMAAAQVQREAAGAGRAVETFEMPQAIPTYLFAFAVGDLAAKDLGPRSRVVAEPATLPAAAWEFEAVPKMIDTAERMFGPYEWDRFDLLVMPPSFPYGGMENPRLTFLTPTILAGDRSLVNVVAHELSHSWTGNLVTNATMNDFWLNEGFTTWAERRILEALDGTEAAALQAAVARRHLDDDVKRLSAMNPAYTRLRTDLAGVDPDEVYSSVPYEKGCLFLTALERSVGRAAFDAFVKRYIGKFRFQSITTAEFLDFVKAELPQAMAKVDVAAWVDRDGVPADAPAARSERLERIEAVAKAWAEGKRPVAADVAGFDATAWQVFLAKLPKRMGADDVAYLADGLGLRGKGNAEIRVGWLTIAAASGWRPADGLVRETLCAWGRGKYLRPLYTALVASGPEGKALGASIYAQAKDGYHPIARGMVEGILKKTA